MKPRHHELWDRAIANPGVEIPLGDTVICDLRDTDYTDSQESGGFLMQSNAVCPKCTPKWLQLLKDFHEEYLIVARCPAGQSFADFVRSHRPPNAAITVTRIPG